MAAIEMEKIVHPTMMSSRGLALEILPAIKAKWLSTNPELVLIKDESTVIKIIKLHDKGVEVNRKQGSVKSKNIFLKKLDHLFDILVCQCPIRSCIESDCLPSYCEGGAHINCYCLKQFKIPTMELMYIKDQREKIGLTGGEMQMGTADKVEAKRQEKNMQRKANKSKNILDSDNDADNSSNMSSNYASVDYSEATKSDNQQNRTDLTFVIAEVARYGISDRAGAALYNAALKTVDLITNDKSKSVVYQAKIRRGRDIFSAKQKKIRQERLLAGGGIECLGSDGKRNKKTRVCEVQIINGVPKDKFAMKTREHIAYTEEPTGEYLCHSEIQKGTGRDLANDFLDVLAEHNSLESVLAVVADGTNTNTGYKDGMIAHVERDLEDPLLWLICLLHGNELGFRHFFELCDGGFGTSGPDSFKGPLGKACKELLHLLNVVNFDGIETPLGDLEDRVWKDLSCDQQLLYRWTKAVASGVVPEELAGQVAGPINHSRWLTLAIRLLELYCKTPNPSLGLCKISKFIVQVYAPSWFKIKCNSKFTSGPANLFYMMKLIKTQPLEVHTVVQKVVQRNGYFADPAVILCSMLACDQEEVRTKAVNIINGFRAKPPKPPRAKFCRKIRKFTIPLLQWDSETWWDIIDWGKVSVFEPRILSRIDTESLEQAISNPVSFPSFPCHSQTVERAVKLVSEAASKVCGGDKRHNQIVSVLASRRARKAFKSKKHYSYSAMDK